MFEIHLFGTTSVRTPDRLLRLDDLPGGKPRQLLEILCLARGAVVTKPVLADNLWAGRPPQHAIATLETYVAVLRRALQPGVAGRETVVRTVPRGYRLDPGRTRLDLDDFDEAVTAARLASPAAAVALWERAADLGSATLLDHEPHAEWAHAARSEYAGRSVRAAVDGAHAALAADRPDVAVALAERAVGRDPLVEDGWQALITAHGRCGSPAGATRAFAACRAALVHELGTLPSPRTRALLRTALAESPTRGPRPLAVAGSP